MKHGFIRTAALTPNIKVADSLFNTEEIIKLLKEASEKQTNLAVFPELCITGYTCNDLFLQDTLVDSATEQLKVIADATREFNDLLCFVGLPLSYKGKLYNCMAAVFEGKVLGFVPKMFLPNYGEFYERRQFTPGFEKCVEIDFDGYSVPFGSKLLFACENMKEFVVGAEVCEDLWTPNPPSISHALNGATVLINGSASNETIGKDRYRRNLVNGQSARLVCTYIYSSAGNGESTQDIVFGAHNIISENGTCLAEAKKYKNESVYGDTDLIKIRSERRKMTTFETVNDEDYTVVKFKMELCNLELNRYFDKAPFVPSDRKERDERCEDIIAIQTMGLVKRLDHINCQSAVIGISGGLDSTLALLITVRAFDYLSIERSKITCVTMPCFGTTDRTYNNAVTLTRQLGCTLREINIKESVTQHFKDIGHEMENHNVTYENGQARERTQILMDIANQTNGIVIGTGDMSELALGWATYNGDHMSMYGVNASVPKTLVKHLVNYFAETSDDEKLAESLRDVLDTPVSPELLPPEKDGTISQKTEDLVGPYELHDFFMYHMLRYGSAPDKIYRMAKIAFAGDYDDETILKWLKKFMWRFFSQQFKRSCLPDGPKVGSVAVSPRGDLRMPSDACGALWIKQLENM